MKRNKNEIRNMVRDELLSMSKVLKRRNPVKLNFWQQQNKEYLYNFMRNDGWGINNPSRQWLKNNINGKTLLDVSCGSGIDYEYLKDRCIYTGMDITPKMIEICKEKFPSGDWIIGDMENINFLNKSFDVVLCRHTVEHLKDYKKAINEFKRVGKKTILILFHKLTPRNIIRKIQGTSTYNNNWSKNLLKYIGKHKIIELPIVESDEFKEPHKDKRYGQYIIIF